MRMLCALQVTLPSISHWGIYHMYSVLTFEWPFERTAARILPYSPRVLWPAVALRCKLMADTQYNMVIDAALQNIQHCVLNVDAGDIFFPLTDR